MDQDELDDEADAVYDEVLEDGGPTSPHPLAGKLSVAVQRGDEDTAAQLVSTLWTLAREKVLTDPDHEWGGKQLEEQDRLREAMRWFTVPLSDFDPTTTSTSFHSAAATAATAFVARSVSPTTGTTRLQSGSAKRPRPVSPRKTG